MSAGNFSALARASSQAGGDTTPPGAPIFVDAPKPVGNEFECNIKHDPAAIENTPLEDGLRNGAVAVALQNADGTDPLDSFTNGPDLIASGVKIVTYPLTDADAGQTSKVMVPQLKKGAVHTFAAVDCDGNLS